MTRETDRQLLIFDLDGTLYHTATSFIPAMNTVFRKYSLPVPDEATLLSFIGEPFTVFLQWLKEAGIPIMQPGVLDAITTIELRIVQERGRLYPGVRETLAHLRDVGCTLALCTNATEDYGQAVVRSCGIEALFHYLRFRSAADKDKAGMVAALLSQIPHRRAYMIGDRYHDLHAGRTNGCTVIAASYGYALPGELNGAEATISSLPALLPLINV
ncbi:HAD family hydrolase [Candidatus Acetothermia bacterium]|nr:HAD family hydrolase [Candidatus Acetothermia bacterium]MCI2425843.1 HAD family hydrolase [Candidatus Acetothermia bacterium]MCI2427391.1 HAD family hydrolase [Candidatus Acetothermia bacterium]MCI2428778.1 HAD family hydrolase [Candidatus Acetothermia bacterium]